MKQLSPLVSIIVPVYKVEKYLRTCVDSILNQTYQNFELILIDDGSPDKCPQICDEYAKKDHRISVIHQKNSGVSLARQAGVNKAEGKYLAFVDSDDWVELNFLDSMCNIINKYTPDIVCFGGYSVRGKVRQVKKFPMECKFYSRKDIVREIYPILIEDKNGRCFPNELWRKIIRRDLYSCNQVVDVKIIMGEDAACMKPCIYHAYSLFIDNGLYYNYRHTDDSITVSGRPLLWDGPALIAEHYKNHIDLSKYDFQEQVNRNIVHNLFNVAVSQYSNVGSYFQISKKIKSELKNRFYQKVAQEAHFSGIEGKICRLAVRFRICIVFYLRWRQKYGQKTK